jgi:hypothetical protein
LEYFRDLKGYLESFRGILKDGIDDHQKRQKSLHELRYIIGGLSEEAGRHLKEVQAAKEWIDALPPVVMAAEEPPPEEEDGSEHTLFGGGGASVAPAPAWPAPAAPPPHLHAQSHAHAHAHPQPHPSSPSPSAPPPRPAAAASGFAAAEPDETISEATLIGGGAEMTMVGQWLEQNRPRMELEYGGRSLNYDGFGKLALGRGSDCQLIVSGRRASRRHAEISLEMGAFMLTDKSTNGTFVVFDNGDRKMLNHGSERLYGSGQIGLGLEPGRDSEHTIVFHCHIPQG